MPTSRVTDEQYQQTLFELESMTPPSNYAPFHTILCADANAHMGLGLEHYLAPAGMRNPRLDWSQRAEEFRAFLETTWWPLQPINVLLDMGILATLIITLLAIPSIRRIT